jgi:hypothetical protein
MARYSYREMVASVFHSRYPVCSGVVFLPIFPRLDPTGVTDTVVQPGIIYSRINDDTIATYDFFFKKNFWFLFW